MTALHFIQSPCGHGYLVDVVPYDGWSDLSDGERENYRDLGRYRWGLIAVVKRTDRDEPVPCCSIFEGDYATESAAQKECDHLKRHAEIQLGVALTLLNGLRREVFQIARVTLDDLIAYRDHMITVKQAEGSVCDRPLCHAPTQHYWWDEDEERDRRSCEEHSPKEVARD